MIDVEVGDTVQITYDSNDNKRLGHILTVMKTDGIHDSNPHIIAQYRGADIYLDLYRYIIEVISRRMDCVEVLTINKALLPDVEESSKGPDLVDVGGETFYTDEKIDHLKIAYQHLALEEYFSGNRQLVSRRSKLVKELYDGVSPSIGEYSVAKVPLQRAIDRIIELEDGYGN